MQITTIGLDIAKNAFQLHGIDAAGEVVVRKRVRRLDVLHLFADLPPCAVGMEACSSALGPVSQWRLDIRSTSYLLPTSNPMQSAARTTLSTLKQSARH